MKESDICAAVLYVNYVKGCYMKALISERKKKAIIIIDTAVADVLNILFVLAYFLALFQIANIYTFHTLFLMCL